jgi:hypothetical protein
VAYSSIAHIKDQNTTFDDCIKETFIRCVIQSGINRFMMQCILCNMAVGQ